jgi:hypothetical protein
MSSKICRKCGEEKALSAFYLHPKTKDGLTGKCKNCTKEDIKERTDRLRENDPFWVEKERIRGREKYYRLGYREQHKASPENKAIINKKYKIKYPEKEKAKSAAQHIVPPSGLVKHHWSYNEKDFKSLIFLCAKDHYLVHRIIKYDPETKFFRTNRGTLLDSKEKSEIFYSKFLPF